MLTDEQFERFQTDGFVLVPDLLTADELAVMRDGVWKNVPSPERYFKDPAAYTHLTNHPFAGLTNLPWA